MQFNKTALSSISCSDVYFVDMNTYISIYAGGTLIFTLKNSSIFASKPKFVERHINRPFVSILNPGASGRCVTGKSFLMPFI